MTVFTRSDFGGFFLPNQSAGTDHGWGTKHGWRTHHLVMGGSVKGKTAYCACLQLTWGGADDVGTQAWELQGCWIPTSSVDQYAATLLRWFGASEGQLDAKLPNLLDFGSMRGLAFL